MPRMITPAIRSDVAMGRLMKGSDKFIRVCLRTKAALGERAFGLTFLFSYGAQIGTSDGQSFTLDWRKPVKRFPRSVERCPDRNDDAAGRRLEGAKLGRPLCF